MLCWLLTAEEIFFCEIDKVCWTDIKIWIEVVIEICQATSPPGPCRPLLYRSSYKVKVIGQNSKFTFTWKYVVKVAGATSSSPTHSVGVSIVLLSGVCCRLSSSVTLHGGPAGGFTRAGQAMTLCRHQSNYSSTVTLHGGPVVLRPVRVTPCFIQS